MTHPLLDEPDIRDLIARAVADEPGYDVADGRALDAAVAAGRRRRARSQASRGLALVAVAATVVGGVALVRVPAPGAAPATGPGASASLTGIGIGVVTSSTVPSPLPTPVPSTTGRTPAPSPSGAPTGGPVPVPSSDPALLADLEAYVRALAAHAHGTVVSLHRDQSPGIDGARRYLSSDVLALVTTPTGTFQIDASTGMDATFDGTSYISSCSPSVGDLKPCTVVGSSKDDVMLSNDMGANPGQAGRTTFQYVAAVPGGEVLNLLFENYVEQPTRAKHVGPSWKDVGLDYPTLRALAKAHGLLP